MTPPGLRNPGREVPLNEALTCVSVATGALAGVTWGGVRYGWLGALIGLPAGMVLGPLVFLVWWIVCFVTIVPLGILCTDGPHGLWEFVRGRWVPPTERPGANQTNESGG
jgi:hypothetical protein